MSQINSFLPTQISTCQTWLDGADTSTFTFSSGSNVSQWNDKSGNGRNAVSPATSNNPVLTTNGVYFSPTNTNSILVFDNYVTSVTSCDLFVVTQPLTVSATNTFRTLIKGGALGTHVVILNSGTTQVGVYYVSMLQFGSLTIDGSQRVLLYVSINGTNQYSAAINGTISLSSPVQGSTERIQYFGNANQYGQPWGYVNEFLVYNNLSQTNRQQVEGYLAWKWGLQTQLPSAHPYSKSPPFSLAIPLPFYPQVPAFGYLTPSFTPTQIPNCQTWFDAADPTTFTLSGNAISAWKDKSSNGYQVLQTTSANQPVYTLNAQNRLSGIQFQTSTYLSNTATNLPNFTTGSQTSVFIAARNADANSGWNIFNTIWFIPGGTNGTMRYHFSFNQGATDGTTLYTNGSLVGQVTSNAVAASANAILGFTASATSATIHTNGSSNSYPGVSLPDATGTTLFLFNDARNDNLASSNVMMFEMVGYNRQVTTSERQQIEGYLAWKWGMQANLPAGHPYASVSPINLTAPVEYPLVFTPSIRGASYNPLSIQGCQLWLDATDPNANGILPLNGSIVSTWYDKSGKGNNATGINNPTFLNKSINFVRSSTQYFTLPNSTLPTGDSSYAYFLICNFNTDSSVCGLIGGGSWGTYNTVFALRNFSGVTSRTIITYWWNNDLLTAPANVFSLNTNFLAESLYTSGGTRAMYGNGNFLTSDSPVARNQTNTNNVLGMTNPTGEGMSGTISEVLVFSNALTTNQRQTIEGYLAWKWGLQGSLPSTHPWVLFPPPPLS